MENGKIEKVGISGFSIVNFQLSIQKCFLFIDAFRNFTISHIEDHEVFPNRQKPLY